MFQEVKIWMRVAISAQADRSGKILIEGEVAEVLTRSANHPHGILVMLKIENERNWVRPYIRHWQSRPNSH